MLGFASSLLDIAAIVGVLIGLQLAVGRTLRDRPLCPTCGAPIERDGLLGKGQERG